MNNLFSIAVLILMLLFFGCQNNSTFIETPVVFDDQVFTLPENSSAGTCVGQIRVTTTTVSRLNFFLMSADYSNAFKIETTTGRLILKDSSLINFETLKQINLEVMVGYEDRSKGYGVFANILIKIEDKLESYLWTADVVSGKNQFAMVNSYKPMSYSVKADCFFASAWTNNLQPNIIRSFMQFDLTGIPSDIQVAGATLSLYNPDDTIKEHKHSCFSGSNAFCIRRITSPWDSQTITWNNQPTYSSEGHAVLPASQTEQQDYENIDISEIVRYIVEYQAKNYGFVIMLDNENFYRRVCFASINHTNEKLRPKLEITYLK